MNQVKIGRFISELRKQAGLTQMQLAEKMNVSDRAVSKWENGKSLPDASIMLDLCNELGITVNDLLSGEVIMVDNYNKEMEKNLLEMIKQKEQADKRLLTMEIVTGIMCILPFLTAAIVGLTIPLEESTAAVMVGASVVPLLIVTPFMLKIEQTAGYYECAQCGHRYVPTYKSVFFAAHMCRTRYMKCPECKKKSWQKKVISKE